MNRRTPPPSMSGKPRPVTHEQIAALAHEIWQERGSPEGSDVDIWLEAERQLNGVPPAPVTHDSIPADPDRIDPDSDPALNPEIDREIQAIGQPAEDPSPTSFRTGHPPAL